MSRPLPAPGVSGRWTARRKIAVLDALTRGEISLADARTRWCLGIEELAAWSRELVPLP